MSQGCERHRGSAGCRPRLQEDGVLHAEVGEGDSAGCSIPPQQPRVEGAAGDARGDRRTEEES